MGPMGLEKRVWPSIPQMEVMEVIMEPQSLTLATLAASLARPRQPGLSQRPPHRRIVDNPRALATAATVVPGMARSHATPAAA